MTRLLKNLRIDEVSCVVKGASPGAQVLIRKADDDPPYLMFDDIMLRKVAEDDPDDDQLTPKLRVMVDALITDGTFSNRQQAQHYLSHNAHGRRLAEHFNNISKTAKEIPMDRATQLREVTETVCKSIVANGTTTITEHDLYDAINEYAKASKRDNETQAMAFTRIFTDEANPDLRAAYAICKGYHPGTN